MTELKTLKDLTFEWGYIDSEEGDRLGDKGCKDLIKQLAIKWVKEYGKGRMIAFMKFHNITEEDLK